MKTTLIMSTPEHLVGECSKICYNTKTLEKGGRDITSTIVHEFKHLASLRFAYATIKVERISVAAQNQIVRSSHLSFMVQSKRYVSINKGDVTFIMPEGLGEAEQDTMRKHWELSVTRYNWLRKHGVAKEDARAVLPANTSTEMYISGNLQGFWSFFKLRLNPHAQLEVRTVANSMYDLLQEAYPLVFTNKLKKELS